MSNKKVKTIETAVTDKDAVNAVDKYDELELLKELETLVLKERQNPDDRETRIKINSIYESIMEVRKSNPKYEIDKRIKRFNNRKITRFNEDTTIDTDGNMKVYCGTDEKYVDAQNGWDLCGCHGCRVW